ncbi:MAG TPA: glycine cleavage system aminomethyltransferase GcvT [Bacteroidales bacterium]|nr:glycine cleavage system aminomethyltransferase GcvT [Bacteroidales bacterium]HRZ50026.1 glycine cleavage system aminomethyltransferase GcvT [Bacteroidales bacterium]
MKNTPFTRFHEAMGAKMVPFAGFNMPIQYEGLTLEHETVRTGVGVFDVSHMGEFWVQGPRAFALVQKLTTNNVAALTDGKVQYTCFPNGRGGIVDDLLVYRIHAEKYLLVVNAANIDKDWEWCLRHATSIGMEPGKDLWNASGDTAQLAVQGPKAMELVQEFVAENIMDMEYYTFRYVTVAGIPDVLVSTTGYTGAGGVEIYMTNDQAEAIWNTLFAAGRKYGLKPIGLGARDTLRLEMGFCLYGNDIDDDHSPIEAGLGWITKFTDGNDFIDRERLEKQKKEGVSRMLRGFEMIDKGIPRQHYEICDAEGNPIGEVTSGTMAPSLKKAIGMGYVPTACSAIGSRIYIRIREKLLAAEIVKLPFFKG